MVNRTMSPTFTLMGMRSSHSSPLSVLLWRPGPTAMTVPRSDFFCALSGRIKPPGVFFSDSKRLTTTLLPMGRNFIRFLLLNIEHTVYVMLAGHFLDEDRFVFLWFRLRFYRCLL